MLGAANKAYGVGDAKIKLAECLGRMAAEDRVLGERMYVGWRECLERENE